MGLIEETAEHKVEKAEGEDWARHTAQTTSHRQATMEYL